MKAVNLIPAEQRKGAGGTAGRSDGAAFVILGLLGGLVVLALVYGISHSQISSRRAQAARLSAQAQTASAQASALAPYSSFITLRNQRVSTVQQLAASRFDWAHAFHELGRVLPNDVSLSTVTGSMAGSTASGPAAPAAPAAAGAPGSASSVTSATPPGSTPSLAITGCTVSQSEVAFTLARLRLMDGVGSVSLQSSTEASSTGTPTSGPSCPVAFQVTVTYNALPTVSTPTSNASAPALSTSSPSTGAAPAAAVSGAN